MSRRTEEPLKLPKSPLIFVLCQVRISPVLAMEEKIPAIQESLRKDGFPRLNRRELKIQKSQEGNTITHETRRQWEFLSVNNRESVIIDTEFLTYQVSKYELFEDFISRLTKVLSLFDYHAEPDLVQRIGLRYIDLVTPSADKSLSDYFSKSIRGFHLPGSYKREGHLLETMGETEEKTKFIHRYLEASKGLGFPAELLPIGLRFDRNLQMKSKFGMLDMDHYVLMDDSFSLDVITEKLWVLHHQEEIAFRASVTRTALKEWEQQ